MGKLKVYRKNLFLYLNCDVLDKTGFFFLFLALISIFLPKYGNANFSGDIWHKGWRVKSTYTNPITGIMRPPIIWEFSSKINIAGGWQIIVKDVSNRIGYKSTLVFDKNRRLIQAEIIHNVRKKEKKITRHFDSNKPALMTNSIIPGSWINQPLPWDGVSKSYIVNRKVGKFTTFAITLQIVSEIIDMETAKERAMLPNDASDILKDKSLLLVSIKKILPDGTKEDQLQQLWSSDMPFWLYEATSIRKSWLLFE